MPYTLLTVKEPGNPPGDDQLYPNFTDDWILQLDDKETIAWQGKASSAKLASKGTSGGWQLRDVEVIITNQRVVYICKKYKKGSVWIGGIGGLIMAASAAKAAYQRQGKAAVGQIRYQWPSGIIQDVSDLSWGGGSVAVMLQSSDMGAFMIKFSTSKQACIEATDTLVQQIAKFRVDRFSGAEKRQTSKPKALAQLTKKDKSERRGKMTMNVYMLAGSLVIPNLE